MNTQKPANERNTYALVMVAVASVFMAMGVGSLWSISIFLKPIIAEFGWLRGETTLAFMAGTISMGVGGIVMGHLADRFSTRWIVLTGALGLAASYLLLARVQSLWQFYLFYCLLGGVGAAALWAPLLANVGSWFEHNKGLAIGLTMSGVALGSATIIKVGGYLIAAYGWQQTYTTLGLICLLVLVPLAFLVRNAPQWKTSAGGKEQIPSASPAVDSISPRLLVGSLSAAALFCCIGFSTNLVHLGALTQDLGFDASSAATLLFLLYIASLAGRVSFGKLSDSVGGTVGFLVATSGQTLLIYWFTQVHSFAGLVLLAISFGLIYSGSMTSLMIAIGQRIPPRRRGISLGIVNLFGWVGNGLGGYQGGYFFDQTGSYTFSYAVAASAGLVAVLILTTLVLLMKQKSVPVPKLAIA